MGTRRYRQNGTAGYQFSGSGIKKWWDRYQYKSINFNFNSLKAIQVIAQGLNERNTLPVCLPLAPYTGSLPLRRPLSLRKLPPHPGRPASFAPSRHRILMPPL